MVMLRTYNAENGWPSHSWGQTLDSQKSALRWDIKRTIKGLCSKLEEIGEDCFVVTANVCNGWVGNIGSTRGDEYINANSHILYDFLNYCGESAGFDSDDGKSDGNDTGDEMMDNIKGGYEIRLDSDPKIPNRPVDIRDLARPVADAGGKDSDTDSAEDSSIAAAAAAAAGDSENQTNSQPSVTKQFTQPITKALLQIPVQYLPNIIPKPVEELSRSRTAWLRTKHGIEPPSTDMLATTDKPLVISNVQTNFLDKPPEKQAETGDKVKKILHDAISSKPTPPLDKKRAKSTDSDSDLSAETMETNTEPDPVPKPEHNLRSSKRRRGRPPSQPRKKPTAAYLLSQQRQTVSSKGDTCSDDSSTEEFSDEVEQDDPKDKDWEIETVTHRTTPRRKVKLE